MGYPKHYNELYSPVKNSNILLDLQDNQIEKPIEDISFVERISLDSRYGISSDSMLPFESQDEDEVGDLRVRSDYDLRVSLMDQIEMRINREARSKAVLFNPNDYSDYAQVKKQVEKPDLKTPDAND